MSVDNYTWNLLCRYIELKEEQAAAFARKSILVFLMEDTYNCLLTLINDSEIHLQREWLINRLHLIVHTGIDFLLSLDDAAAVTNIIRGGPSWFTNPLAMRILQEKRKNEDLKFQSIQLIQTITEHKNKLREEAVKKPAIKEAITQFFLTNDEEQKIRLLKQAMTSIKGETAAVPAYVQFLLGSTYATRLQGVRSVNLETAIGYFNKALSFYTKNEYPYNWSAVQNGLGRCYAIYQTGDPGNNIEKAIECFTNSLEGFTAAESPYDWALSQNNLGASYLERIKGNKAENIQRAIAYFTNALEVQHPDFTPGDWAMTMSNLGNAYNNAQHPDSVSTAKKAIGYYKEALSVYTKEDSPFDWANTQVKIADAYQTMAADAREENLERSLHHATLSLKVLSSTNAPNIWAYAQSVLGAAYMERIKGERLENLELAIEHITAALRVNTREHAPYSWAIHHLNLGNCYRKRLRGNAIDNQEKAIQHLQQSLQMLNRSGFPNDWAAAQHMLGIAYCDRLTGDKADNYEKAIKYYQDALTVRTPENVLSNWIESMNNLGNTYKNRIHGNKADNLEKAIACYAPLEKMTDLSENPRMWAIVQYNSGLAFMERINGDAEQNKAAAVRYFQRALTIHTPLTEPIECFKISINLGKLYFRDAKYAEAREAFEPCHQSIEHMRTQSAREYSRRQLAAECREMYEMMVYACLSMHDIDKAFYYVSAAKARIFADKLGALGEQPSKMLQNDPAFSESWNLINGLRQEIDELISRREFIYTRGEYIGEDGVSLAATLEIRQTKLALLLEDLYFRFPELSLTGNAPIADPGQIRQLSKNLGNIPLVEYYQHHGGWGAFVICPEDIKYVDLPGISDELISGIKQCMIDYENGVLAGNDPNTYTNGLSTHLSDLYRAAIHPLAGLLPAEGPLVIAAAKDLHLLPFNIAYNTENKKYLTDLYTITYIPSLTALYVLHKQQRSAGPLQTRRTLLSVVYSAAGSGLSPLPNAKKEAKIIADYFLPAPPSIYLHEQEATPQQVLSACGQQQFDTIHFSCHGYFNFNDPENSGLVLKGGLLTVERIQTALRLPNRPVIILSACQTGLSRPGEGDEAVGLIQSFFAAGAGSVISSQWSVNDLSTKEFFQIFYEKCKTMKMAAALRAAMLAIRQEQKWQHPVYWAAFKITGLQDL